MAKILLGCIQDLLLSKGVKAIWWLLDFIYLAQYSTHDTATLQYLCNAFQKFHQHKDYFIDVEIHPSLNIPKLHSLVHYAESIELFGTTDNYNTEMFERLHIDFAKHGWQSSNQRNEFPQMICWLSRQEKINKFSYILSAQNSGLLMPPPLSTQLPIYMAKCPQLPL